MKTTDPREILLDLADKRGVSLAALSAMIGRNAAYLQQFIRKNSPRRLAEADRRMLARFFGVDESLLGASQDNSYDSAQIASKSDWCDVPRLALGASAGPGALSTDELPVGTFRFSARWLRGQGLDPGHLSAIAVAGDSMEPSLRDGDEILVDRRPRGWRDGVHVVRCHDALLVKRIDLSAPGRVVLRSDNPAYPPLSLAPAEVSLVGRVVWKSGRL